MCKILFILFLNLFMGFNFSICLGQINLGNREIKLEVIPGEKTTGTISLDNVSDTAVTVKSSFEDFIYEPPYEGIKRFIPARTNPRSCAEWISLVPEVFIIPAGGRQEINYSINVPPEAKGGYTAVVFFEKEAAGAGENIGLGLVIKTGCSFFVETKDKTRELKITEIFVSDNKISGKFLNSGNVILIAEPSVYIMDKAGLVADRGGMKKIYLPPEENTPFTAGLSKRIQPGSWTLVFNFDLDGGGVLLKEIAFTQEASGIIKVGEGGG